jgi:hypothetical protein
MRVHRTRSIFPEAISRFSCSKTLMRACTSKSKSPTRVFACTSSRPDVCGARNAATATRVLVARRRSPEGAIGGDVAKSGHGFECSRVAPGD